MKQRQLVLFIGSLIFFSSNLFGQLTWSPENIVAGQNITLSYNPEGTPLENEKVVYINLYQVYNSTVEVQEVPVQYNKGTFTGTFKVEPSTKALFFVIYNEALDALDNNNEKGYKSICYQADGKTPLEGAYTSKARIVSDFSSMLDAKFDGEAAIKLLEKEFERLPASSKDIRLQNFHLGLAVINKDEAAISGHEKLANTILTKKNPSEDELSYIHKYTQRVKEDKEAATAIKNQIIAAYPKSTYAARDLSGKIRDAKDVSEKIAILEQWNTMFGSDKSKNSTKNYIISQIASQYKKANDWDNFRKYFDMIDDASRKAGILNGIAWSMSGESLEGEAKSPKEGLKLSKESLELMEKEMQEMKSKSKTFTARLYKNRLKYSYSTYADTYALLAYKLDRFEEALKYQTIACENDKFRNGEMNDRYCAYFEKQNDAKASEKMIANLIAQGKATSKMKERHKELFLANNTMESAYDKYAVQLEKSALEAKRKKLEAKMISEPAPNFELVNLQGEKVILDELRGKVVVVDFWATWCGPCVASFPGMQKAVDKFAKSEDVEFVFIDTWESGDNITEKVTDFITSKNYSFNVLMDLESSVVSSYGVTGIPAKFIIDKEGMIKFNSKGSNGNDEEIVNEISMMIELAGGTIPTAMVNTP